MPSRKKHLKLNKCLHVFKNVQLVNVQHVFEKNQQVFEI